LSTSKKFRDNLHLLYVVHDGFGPMGGGFDFDFWYITRPCRAETVHWIWIDFYRSATCIIQNSHPHAVANTNTTSSKIMIRTLS